MALPEPDDLSESQQEELAEEHRRDRIGAGPKIDGRRRTPKGACLFCGDDADGYWNVHPVCLECQLEVVFGIPPRPKAITGRCSRVPFGFSIRSLTRVPGTSSDEKDYFGETWEDS